MRLKIAAVLFVILFAGMQACKKSSSPAAPSPSAPAPVVNTNTPTPTPSATGTAPTATHTVTATVTHTSSMTATPTFTRTFSATFTPTITHTYQFSPTFTTSPTFSDTLTNTVTSTYTMTYTHSATATRTTTMTSTFSPSVTATACGSTSSVGFTAQGPSGTVPFDLLYAIRVQPSDLGILTQVSFWAGTGNSSSVARVGVYGGSSTAPGALLCQAGPIYAPSSGYYTVDVPDISVAAGQYYWIALQGYQLSFNQDNTRTGSTWRYVITEDGPLPSDLSAGNYVPSTFPSISASICVNPLTATPTWSGTATNTFSPSHTRTITPTEVFLCNNWSILGDTGTGAVNTAADHKITVKRIVPSQNGTIMSLVVRLNGAYSADAQGVVYENSGTSPNALLVMSLRREISGTGYFEIDIPDLAVSAGVTYWIGVYASGAACYMIGDGSTVDTVTGTYDISNHYTFPTPETPISLLVGAKFCDPNAPTVTPTKTPTVTSTVCGISGGVGYVGDCTNKSSIAGIRAVRGQAWTAMSGVSGTVVFRAVSGTDSGVARVAVYNDAAGVPGTLLTESDPVAVTAAGVVTMGVPVITITAGEYYWVAVMVHDFELDYDTGGEAGTGWLYDMASDNVFPASLAGGAANNARIGAYAAQCYPAFTNTLTPWASYTPTRTVTSTATLTPTVTPTLSRTPCSAPTPFGWPTEIYNSGFLGLTTRLHRVGGPGTAAGRVVSTSMIVGNSGTFRTYIYADNGSGTAPTSLLTYSALLPVGAYGWHQADVPDVAIAADAYYWVGFWLSTDAIYAYTDMSATHPVYSFTAEDSTPQDPCPTGSSGMGGINNVVAEYCSP